MDKGAARRDGAFRQRTNKRIYFNSMSASGCPHVFSNLNFFNPQFAIPSTCLIHLGIVPSVWSVVVADLVRKKDRGMIQNVSVYLGEKKKAKIRRSMSLPCIFH
jgi:hypothetical protein